MAGSEDGYGSPAVGTGNAEPQGQSMLVETGIQPLHMMVLTLNLPFSSTRRTLDCGSMRRMSHHENRG